MEDNNSSLLTTASAEVVGLNEDLLTEILIRVPAKPLLKFKCVSKKWLSLISDPKFCHSHALHLFTHNPTPSALLLNNDYNSSPEFDIVPLKDDHPKVPYLDYLNVPRIKILQSCNGLLLCLSTYLRNPSDQSWKEFMSEMTFSFRSDYSSLVVTDDDKGVKYFICNPTTKQFKMISCPFRKLHVGISSPCFYLAFDPLKSPHYKVLLLRHFGDGKYDIDIYFSETDSWSFERHSFQELPEIITSGCVFFNGAIHWLSFGKKSVYFEVLSESLKTFPMPLTVDTCAVKYFGESQGHLHMGVAINQLDLEFDVWELELDYSGWFVKYHVNLQSMKKEFPELVWDQGPRESPFTVLSLIRGEKEEDSALVLFVDHKAISHSLLFRTSNELCDLQSEPQPPDCPFIFYLLDFERGDAFEYIETLIRV